MVASYPGPDPQFEAQAMALMKQKQDQLNQEVAQEVTPEPEVTPTVAKKSTKKSKISKTGASIKKDEVIVTPEPEVVVRKPYYIEGEVLAGGSVVGFFSAHKGVNGLTLGWSKPSMMAELEGLMISGANILEDGVVVDSIDPNTESWRFIENLPRLFLGNPFSGGEVYEIDEVEE